MIPCDNLPTLDEDYPVSMGDFTEYTMTIIHNYGDCSSKLYALQAWETNNP